MKKNTIDFFLYSIIKTYTHFIFLIVLLGAGCSGINKWSYKLHNINLL